MTQFNILGIKPREPSTGTKEHRRQSREDPHNKLAVTVRVFCGLDPLCNESGKFKSIFVDIASDSHDGPVGTIKALCPTRWLVRLSALQSAIRQYNTLKSLTETSKCSHEVRLRAAGLLSKFQEVNTLMCLVMTTKVIEPLECLNRASQSQSATISSI